MTEGPRDLSQGRLTLDHAGILSLSGISDLVSEFRQLGFDVGDPHELLAPAPDGSLRGLGQWSTHLLFDQTYVELTAVPDPQAGHHLERYFDLGPGVRLILFQSRALDVSFGELRRSGVETTAPGVQEAARPGIGGEARFRWLGLDPQEFPEALIRVGRTPDARESVCTSPGRPPQRRPPVDLGSRRQSGRQEDDRALPQTFGRRGSRPGRITFPRHRGLFGRRPHHRTGDGRGRRGGRHQHEQRGRTQRRGRGPALRCRRSLRNPSVLRGVRPPPSRSQPRHSGCRGRGRLPPVQRNEHAERCDMKSIDSLSSRILKGRVRTGRGG